jgi:hypothetical protein
MMRGRVAAVLLAAVLVAGALLWWGTRSAPDPVPATGAALDDPAPADTTDAERERLRADIAAHRAGGAAPEQRLAGRTALQFAHAQHRDIQCLECHEVTDTHGALNVTDVRQCRECHHAPPLSATCTRCHRPAAFTGERRPVAVAFSPSVSAPVTRQLVFAHAQHATQRCTACHQEPVTLAVTVGCRDCHQDHHQPQVQCMGCHIASPRGAHTIVVHVGCTGSGCHDVLPAPIRQVPRAREFCLVCHQELVNHERGGNCADCHRLPPPGTAGGRTPAEAIP